MAEHTAHALELERRDIQGLVVSAYAHLPCAAYLLLRVTEAAGARAWLAQIVGDVTTAGAREDGTSINVALTFAGLQALGLDADTLDTFPFVFRDGMASETRARILGDSGASHPDAWRWGNTANPVHVLLLLYGADEPTLDAYVERRRGEVSRSGGVAHVLTLGAGRQPDTREHFGFNDGIGQPVIEGSGRFERQMARTGHATVLKAGEFILGHVDGYGLRAPGPTTAASADPERVLDDAVDAPRARRDLGRNGSYLVFRQMEQHVATFWRYMDEQTRRDGASDPAAREHLAAKVVGRWPSGAPLVRAPEADDPSCAADNDFGYLREDPHGHRCPVGAHIRRCNPRDALGPNPDTALRSAHRHRLLRRGRLYGPHAPDPMVDDGVERGLHFICLNSDIDRQFEFVQQTWINNASFDGLQDEVDPLIGRHGAERVMTIQRDPIRKRIHGLPDFVTVRGGAYFFLPGVRALRYLATQPRLTGQEQLPQAPRGQAASRR